MFFNTFPPWNADRKQVEKIKQQQAVGTEPVSEPEVVPSLGKAANSGGKTHTRLLIGAKRKPRRTWLQSRSVVPRCGR